MIKPIIAYGPMVKYALLTGEITGASMTLGPPNYQLDPYLKIQTGCRPAAVSMAFLGARNVF
jgi:hypothetical protein